MFSKRKKTLELRTKDIGHQKLTMTNLNQWLKHILYYIGFWMPKNHRRSICSKGIRYPGNGDIWCKGRKQFSMPIPDLSWHNQSLKNWTGWAIKFASLTLLPILLPADPKSSSFSTTVFKEMLPQLADAKNAYSKFTKTQNQYFHVTRINKLISLEKNVLLENGSYFQMMSWTHL